MSHASFIHGEPGRRRVKLSGADDIAAELTGAHGAAALGECEGWQPQSVAAHDI